MSDGSMFEEPDFSRAQPAGADGDDPDGEVGDFEDEQDELEDELEEDELEDEEELEDEAELEDEEDELEEEAEAEGGSPAAEVGDGAVTNRAQGSAAGNVLAHVTRTLVDDPDSVIVEVSEGRSGVRFSVHVAPGDMGRVIGRKGRTAQAIRTLVRAAAAADGTEASVDIVD